MLVRSNKSFPVFIQGKQAKFVEIEHGGGKS